MLDDHRRAERLRREPRTDLSFAERMLRFAEALQFRLVREFERLEGGAAFGEARWEHAGAGGGLSRSVEGGRLWERGSVEVAALRGTLSGPEAEALGVEAKPFFSSGIALAMYPRVPRVPAVFAGFRHVALGEDPRRPEGHGFEAQARLAGAGPEAAGRFLGAWRRVCGAHPGVAECVVREDGSGLRFVLSREDPEGAFLAVRQAGRAFLPAYVPLVEGRLGLASGARAPLLPRPRGWLLRGEAEGGERTTH